VNIGVLIYRFMKAGFSRLIPGNSRADKIGRFFPRWFLPFAFIIQCGYSKTVIEAGDPPNNRPLPAFYKGTLDDIDQELRNVRKGNVKAIAVSPGGLPVYAVYYGDRENFHSQANYNSALGAGNPAFFARKGKATKPVVYFIGPVHGQEAEGIVGLVNLIQLLETGKDYRGREWTNLSMMLNQCRVVIVPCGNPDGRSRCPYDSFVGLPVTTMTKYGQGTRKDGSLWGWPLTKSLHPMRGEVGILGAYYNDDGINMMHDDFFAPMAEETKAIMEIARSEAPDMTVSLHSHGNPPRILPAAYEAWFMKQRIDELTKKLNVRYQKEGLPHPPLERLGGPAVEDQKFPPRTSFNLISALHHVSGTMAFTFECPHGTTSERNPTPIVSYAEILDIQLLLYEEMLDYLLKNRLYWE
jgi:hypothetical protein